MMRFSLAASFALLIAFPGTQVWSQTTQPAGAQVSAKHHRVVHSARRYVYDPNDPSEGLNKQELQRLGLQPVPEFDPCGFHNGDGIFHPCYVH
jgi:hypothetical protein